MSGLDWNECQVIGLHQINLFTREYDGITITKQCFQLITNYIQHEMWYGMQYYINVHNLKFFIKI